MNAKRILAVPERTTIESAALLLLRVVGGSAFMLHGWSKIQNPFGWMGANGFAPPAFQALAALSEFGGGLAWVLGLVTPLATAGIASTMMVAFYTHTIRRGDPFVSNKGGGTSELASIYLCIALLFLALGPGRFSLDRRIFGRR